MALISETSDISAVKCYCGLQTAIPCNGSCSNEGEGRIWSSMHSSLWKSGLKQALTCTGTSLPL